MVVGERIEHLLLHIHKGVIEAPLEFPLDLVCHCCWISVKMQLSDLGVSDAHKVLASLLKFQAALLNRRDAYRGDERNMEGHVVADRKEETRLNFNPCLEQDKHHCERLTSANRCG